MAKCKHNVCEKKATENGYCASCIQLPAKRCNHCNGEDYWDEKQNVDNSGILIVIGIFLGIIALAIFLKNILN